MRYNWPRLALTSPLLPVLAASAASELAALPALLSAKALSTLAVLSILGVIQRLFQRCCFLSRGSVSRESVKIVLCAVAAAFSGVGM